jgi:hypothetical protein
MASVTGLNSAIELMVVGGLVFVGAMLIGPVANHFFKFDSNPQSEVSVDRALGGIGEVRDAVLASPRIKFVKVESPTALTARSRASCSSWGEDLRVELEGAETSETRLVVSSTPVRSGPLWTDFGRGERLVREIANRLREDRRL